MTAEAWERLLESWRNRAEGGPDEHTGPESVRGVQEQWVQHRRPDGSLENVGPGMTPSEGAVPTGTHQP